MATRVKWPTGTVADTGEPQPLKMSGCRGETAAALIPAVAKRRPKAKEKAPASAAYGPP
jgi:hypothetical protein